MAKRKRVIISDPNLSKHQQYIINTLSYYKSIMKMKNCHSSKTTTVKTLMIKSNHLHA